MIVPNTLYLIPNTKLFIMKKQLLLLLALVLCTQGLVAQVYVDEFDNGDPILMGGAATFSFSESDDELTVSADGTGGPWDVFTYQPHDMATGEAITVDATGNNKIFIKAKASNVGTQLRMDVQDAEGYLTSLAGITKTLTTEYIILEYDFSGQYSDGGFGGTPCTSDTAPCEVDGSQTTQLLFYVNPGAGGYAGDVVIDYIAFGEEPTGVIVSTVFQDHFDDVDSTVTSFGTDVPESFELIQEGTELTIRGDGNAGPWDALGFDIRNQNTWEPIDIDISENHKLFIKIKSSVPNTAFRIDVQDIDGFITTQGSITKLVDTEYSVIEYNYVGTYNDLGYGGTPCTESTAPCPVDPTRVGSLVFYIEPGVGAYLGDLTIDYISFGNSLEEPGDGPQFIYGDHFNNNTTDWTADTPGFIGSEEGTEWTITGDGTGGQYAALAYSLHTEDGEPLVLDLTSAKNKFFIKAKASTGEVPLRVDLIDTTGYATSLAGLTKIITGDYEIYEYDFTGNLTDGGYGGTACETGPCPVDGTAIETVLIYIDPVQGAYEGAVTIDFVSFGQPLGEDEIIELGPVGIINYSDQMDDNTSLYVNDMDGLVSSFASDIWTITGNGTSGAFAPVVYDLHNDVGEFERVDVVGSNNILYVMAKADVDGTVLRIDVQDGQEFVSNQIGVANTLTTEYAVYEYNYEGAYLDGGYGGSPCTSETAPCEVDGQRIDRLQFFINPGEGMFNGMLDIDWISFGEVLTSIQDYSKLSSLRAFPNPSSDKVFLDFALVNAANININVYDNLGRLVAREYQGQIAVGSNQQSINLSQLQAGIYFLQLQADGASAGTLRVVKK